MSWFHLYVEDVARAGALDELLANAIFRLLAQGKRDAAAFRRFDPSGSGGNHFFLSPEAAPTIAKEPPWTPCDPPSRTEAGSVVAGDQTRIDALFQ
jgi:hypothetical protein